MARPDGPEGPMRWLQFQQLVKMAEYTGGNLEAAHNMLLEQAQARRRRYSSAPSRWRERRPASPGRRRVSLNNRKASRAGGRESLRP